jgi:hypothetical protein
MSNKHFDFLNDIVQGLPDEKIKKKGKKKN